MCKLLSLQTSTIVHVLKLKYNIRLSIGIQVSKSIKVFDAKVFLEP